MSEENMSILSEHRTGPSGEPEVLKPELMRCHNFACDYETYDDNIKKCPMCGRNMLDGKTFRVLGGILIGLGVILAGLGGSLLFFLHDKMPKNDEGRRMVALTLFIAILFAGLLAIAAGVRQIFTGNKNRPLIRMTLVAFSAISLIVIIVRFLF